MDRDDLVELRKFSHLHEAEIAVATLEASDIDAVLRDTSYGGFRPEASIGGGGVTVLVRRDQRDAASEILDAPALHDAPTDAVTCANCGRSLRGAVCSACDADEHEAVLDPARTRRSIDKLKAAVVFGTLALMVVPVIWRRVSQFDVSAVKTALYLAAGVVVLIVVLKFFVASSDERL